MYVYVCMCMYVYVYVCMCMYVYACMYVYVYVCISMASIVLDKPIDIEGGIDLTTQSSLVYHYGKQHPLDNKSSYKNSEYYKKHAYFYDLIQNISQKKYLKARKYFKSLTESEILGNDTEFKIKLTPDAKKNTLTISDNGIGMTHDDAIIEEKVQNILDENN